MRILVPALFLAVMAAWGNLGRVYAYEGEGEGRGGDIHIIRLSGGPPGR